MSARKPKRNADESRPAERPRRKPTSARARGQARRRASVPKPAAPTPQPDVIAQPDSGVRRSRRLARIRSTAEWAAKLLSEQSRHLAGISRVLPILLGLGFAWQWRGAERIVAPALEPSASAPFLLGSVLLLALAVGPHMPERLLAPIAAWLRRRSKSGSPVPSSAAVEAPDVFRRSALAFLGATAGVAALAQLAFSGLFLRIHEYLLQHFFWTGLTRSILDWMGVALLFGFAWCIQGLMLVVLGSLQSVRSTGGRLMRTVTAEVLMGGAAGSVTGAWLLDGGSSGHQLYLLGVLPLFAMAILCVRSVPSAPIASPSIPIAGDPPEVHSTDEWMGMAALVTCGVAATLCIQGLRGCQSQIGEGVTPDLAWFLFTFGMGFLISFPSRPGNRGSLGDAGVLLWITGLCVGAGLWMRAGSGTPVLVGIAAAGLGASLSGIEQAMLARLSWDRTSLAQLTTSACTGAAIGLAVAYWWASPRLGAAGVVVLAVLMLLATAGFLQIYTQDRESHVRHTRLGLVFASLAAAILLLPPQARGWAHRERILNSLMNAEAPDASLAAAIDRSRRVCWIAPSLPSSVARPSDSGKVRFLRTFRSGGTEIESVLGGVVPAGYLHYELIYQCWPEATERFPQYTVDWFQRLLDVAAPSGALVVDVPIPGMGNEAIEVIAATLFRASETSVTRESLIGPFGPCIRLIARPRASLPSSTDSPRTSASRPMTGPVHSLWRDRLTRTVRSKPRTAGGAGLTMRPQ